MAATPNDLATTPFLSDALWLLTTGPEKLQTGPQAVLLGVAAAGLRDLETIGEVTWSGVGDAASLIVQQACRCENEELSRWHKELRQTAGTGPLPARFTLGPLRSAWRDTAERLARAGTVTRMPAHQKDSFSVVEPAMVGSARSGLRRALQDGRLDQRQHELAVVAWAVGCFDDLFNVHGIEAPQSMLEAARQETIEDATYGRICAAAAFSSVQSAHW